MIFEFAVPVALLTDWLDSVISNLPYLLKCLIRWLLDQVLHFLATV